MGSTKSKQKSKVSQTTRLIPPKKASGDLNQEQLWQDSLLFWLNANATKSSEDVQRLRPTRKNIRLFLYQTGV